MSNRQLDEEAIFHIARDLADTEKRATYLDQVCAGDQALRERVEALLETHENEQSFLMSKDELPPTIRLSRKTSKGSGLGQASLISSTSHRNGH
jgi:hypothetical protein